MCKSLNIKPIHVCRFGVCCVFIFESSASTITQNCSYIRNPNYPAALDSTSTITYTIQKCSSGITLILPSTCIKNKQLLLWGASCANFIACELTSIFTFSDVCQLRLDFEQFTTNGPAGSTELQAGTIHPCQDTLIVSVMIAVN